MVRDILTGASIALCGLLSCSCQTSKRETASPGSDAGAEQDASEPGDADTGGQGDAGQDSDIHVDARADADLDILEPDGDQESDATLDTGPPPPWPPPPGVGLMHTAAQLEVMRQSRHNEPWVAPHRPIRGWQVWIYPTLMREPS